MADVVVTRLFPDPGPQLLRDAFDDVTVLSDLDPVPRADLLEAVPGCRGIVGLLSEPMNAELMDAAGDSLAVIANYAVGFDNIDVAEATARGICVANTPDVLTNASAECAAALMLAAARHVVPGDRMTREGRFRGWEPMLMLGMELHGKTVGIVGAGRIGRAFARICRGFGMHVLYTARSDKPAFEADTGARRVDLGEMLKAADVLSLHVPLTPHTRHMIDADAIAAMKPGSMLINTGRGPVVDEAALVDALRDGHLSSAGFDVYEREPELSPGLADLPNVVLLPHVGSATFEARGAMAELAARAVIDVVAGRQPSNLVNPEVWPNRRGA